MTATEQTTIEQTTIERTILIRAPRARVWRALTAPAEFSRWFSADVAGAFTPGKRVDMVSTHSSCAGDARFYVVVEKMEPEHTFAWRWHPGAASAEEDGTTHVQFSLEEIPEGTRVTVTETGFDRIALERRAQAFAENGNGWKLQLEALGQYAGQAA